MSVYRLRNRLERNYYTMPLTWHHIDLGFAELYTMPCASMALATFMKPATLAPFT